MLGIDPDHNQRDYGAPHVSWRFGFAECTQTQSSSVLGKCQESHRGEGFRTAQLARHSRQVHDQNFGNRMTTSQGVCAQDGNMRLHLGLRSSVEKICSPELGRMCRFSSDLKEAQVLALFCPRAQRAASRSWKRSCFVWYSYVVSVCLSLSLCGGLPLDPCGHHRAACVHAGVLGRRGWALENVLADVSGGGLKWWWTGYHCTEERS